MTIQKNRDNDALTFVLEGRLDTTTAPMLEGELGTSLDGIGSLILDFSNLEYVSSAGLRVIMAAYKAMKGKGAMKITHVNEVIREIFDVTGFSRVLNIE